MERFEAENELDRDIKTGQYLKAPQCDCCGKPCSIKTDPEDPDSGTYFTDDDVCGNTEGPSFFLCARKRCGAKYEGLGVEERRAIFTAGRARNEGP